MLRHRGQETVGTAMASIPLRSILYSKEQERQKSNSTKEEEERSKRRRNMEFSSNNSCYSQDLYTGLDKEFGFWHLRYNLQSQGFFDPSLQTAFAYPATKFEATQQPLMASFPENPAMERSRTVELPSNSEIGKDNDGCTFEELIQLVNQRNEETTVNPNPWHEVAQTISSSSCDSKQQKKGRRIRRPSVRFVDLMNKNKLLLGDRVYYRRKKENRDLAVGILRHPGIECCCCGEIYSMSKFEEHAGKVSHRAPSHIYLENGKSLENLQLEILEDHTN